MERIETVVNTLYKRIENTVAGEDWCFEHASESTVSCLDLRPVLLEASDHTNLEVVITEACKLD